MEHSQLAAEIPSIEKLTTAERLKLAKKRRLQQLKKYSDYERKLEKTKKRKPARDNVRGKKARLTFLPAIGFLEAAARNDIAEVRAFLEAGVSPDVTNEDGLTALHQCCIDDSEAMLQLLLEFGANVNAKDSELWTPLHAAATCGHLHLCKHLVEKGAELLAVNSDGNMPYDLCEEETTLDYIENEMAKRNITQEQIDETRGSLETRMLRDVQELVRLKADLSLPDANGATLLHIACANGYSRVVQCLLTNGADVHVQDVDSWRPIHGAACWGHAAAIEALVQSGADIDSATKSGETPYDISEDHEVKQRILALRDELASRAQQHVTSEIGGVRRRASSNKRSASIRRTSMREKNNISRRNEHEFLNALHKQDADEAPAVSGAREDDYLNGIEVEFPDDGTNQHPSPTITAGRSPTTTPRDVQHQAELLLQEEERAAAQQRQEEEARREEELQAAEARRAEELLEQERQARRLEEQRKEERRREEERREEERQREASQRPGSSGDAHTPPSLVVQPPTTPPPQEGAPPVAPRRMSRTREESEEALKQEQYRAQMQPSPQQPLSRGSASPSRDGPIADGEVPYNRYGTLADLKKQRRQMMMQRRESSSSIPQSPVTNGGRSVNVVNSHSNEPQVKYRFSAATNEVIGAPEESQNKFVSMKCCGIM